MSRRAFADSHLVAWNGLRFEIVDRRGPDHRQRLDGLKEEVLRIAALSRGWDDAASLALFRRSFKIGPLYEADALALVYRDDELVGIAGTVKDWTVGSGAIVHLCSLGLLPQVQRRGLLQAFMSLLWIASLADSRFAAHLARGTLYTTAITQSPYILGLMQRVADIFPSPDRATPRPDELQVAHAVLARFDPHLALEAGTFVVRNECAFRYRRLPESLDRRLTRFCSERLRYQEGDVFVVVGTVRAGRVQAYVERQHRQHPELLRALLASLRGRSPQAVQAGAGAAACARSA